MKKAKPKHPTAAEKKRVIALVEKWRGLLFLNGWSIDVVFKAKTDDGDGECAARCTVNLPYQGARVYVYDAFWDESEGWLEYERKLIHELCHCLTRRMKGFPHELLSERLVTWREVKEADEHLTDWIANVVFALFYKVRRE